jgi:hypothetical protein
MTSHNPTGIQSGLRLYGGRWYRTDVSPWHEDFQSSCRSGTMCHHWSLLVSIQAFNAASSQSILPIRADSVI